MVISGGSYQPDVLKSSEVVSMLLDDAEIEAKSTFWFASRNHHFINITTIDLIVNFTRLIADVSLIRRSAGEAGWEEEAWGEAKRGANRPQERKGRE